MSDFEKDILSRIAAQNEELEGVIAEKGAPAREQMALRARAVKLGSEVVSLLHERNIPTTPIWVKKKVDEVPFTDRPKWRGGTYSGVDHIFEYKEAGEGWKILNTFTTDEGYSIGDRLALSESGDLLTYHSLKTERKSQLIRGPNVQRGIVSPKLINPERSINLVESDLFKNACAHLIRTGEPFNAKGDLFLHFHSESLDDSWNTKI